jgi:hypothetical protein
LPSAPLTTAQMEEYENQFKMIRQKNEELEKEWK